MEREIGNYNSYVNQVPFLKFLKFQRDVTVSKRG